MARPKKSSNYKVIQDIDLSKNNIYNVNAIVGNSYDFEPNDLIITTYDTDEDIANLPSNAGNLILRAGVADKDLAYSGSVHIFAGNEVKPNEGSTVLDKLASSVYSPLNGKSSRVKNGITVDPDEGVFIKSEISSEGKVSIEAKKNLSIESKSETTFNSPTVTKNVTTEEDEVGTLTETFTTEHTETANKLNIYAGSYKSSDLTLYNLTVESNHKKDNTDSEHSYINVDEIVVDKTVTEGTSDAKVIRTTHTSSDTNTSDDYTLSASGTLEIDSKYGSDNHSYIKVDEIVIDNTVTEGTDGAPVERTVYSTNDKTTVTNHLMISAPEFKLDAEVAHTDTEGKSIPAKSSLEVTEITSTDNNLTNLNLGATGHVGKFVVDNNEVDIDTNTLSINVQNLKSSNPSSKGTIFELSADATSSSSSMHIDNVTIDNTLSIGSDSVKSTSAEIYTKEFVLDTNDDKATGLSVTGKNDLEITDHHKPSTTEKSTESYIKVDHTEVGTIDVVTDRADDVIVYKSLKTNKNKDTTNASSIDVFLTGNSDPVSVDKDNANKINDVEINSTKINIKGGATTDTKDNLHITSSLTRKEADERLKTKGLDEGDSFIETDDLRINKNFYANQFYIYWDDRINSLVFANSEQTPKG